MQREFIAYRTDLHPNFQTDLNPEMHQWFRAVHRPIWLLDPLTAKQVDQGHDQHHNSNLQDDLDKLVNRLDRFLF